MADYTDGTGIIKEVDYLDGFQYAGEVLQFFPHSEGYVSATPGQSNVSGTFTSYIFNYVYNYTDHLGNIRVSYSKDPVNGQLKIMEENHYYPFGLKHTMYAEPKQKYELVDNMENLARPSFVNQTDYQYKYNGKELQDELGLGLYDYGARNYDPALGRWNVIDPLAEMYYSFSTYNYAANNPIVFIDPNGMNLDWYQDDGGDYVYDASITSQQDLTDAGIEGTYLGESTSFGVNQGGEQVGTMNLNADGSANFTTTDGQITEFSDMTVDMGFESGNKIMAGNYQNGDLFDKGNFIAGAGAIGLEHTRGSFRFGTTTQGFSPKYYGNSWGGNQYAKTFNIGRIGKALGPIGFGAGVVKDGIGVVNGSTSFGKAGLNTTMGALGFTGWGLPASLLYGGLEAFYPGQTVGAMSDYSTVQSAYRDTNNGSLWKSQK